MPVTGVYEWDENAETLVVRVPLKGVVRSTVDVFVSDVLVKVNYAPYLLVLDLLHPVDDTGSKAVFQDGSLVLSLPKQTPALWGAAVIDPTSVTKAELKARRDKALEDKTAREQALSKAKKDARHEAQQRSMKREWAIVDSEKKHIEDLKQEEKSQAEEDVYRALAKVQAETEEKERRLKAKLAKKARGGTSKKVVFDESDVAPSRKRDPVTATRAQDLPPPRSPAEAARRRKLEQEAERAGGVLETKQEAPPSADRGIFTEADTQAGGDSDGDAGAESSGEEDEDEDEEDIVYVPPPRETAKFAMSFTERIFPTPLRESKVAQEEDWIAKNKVALDKRRKQLNPDARDISERDPVWLKGKADDFYRAGDFRAAANAYTAAIAADSSVASCYSNRAACWLAIGELDKCVEDCTETLDMLPAPADLAKMMQAPDPHPDQVQWHRLCCKVLVRRGTALCRLGKYEKALENYQLASELNPSDASLVSDVARIQNLMKCAGLKAMGDQAYRARDVAGAIKQYTAALSFDPSFVSCLSNRAACHLASNQLHECVEDCTTALRLMRCDHGSTPAPVAGPAGKVAVASGPVPEPGTERHKAWLMKTMVRRGAALVKLGRLTDARRDYEKAVVLDPSNQDLLQDLARIRARCAKDDGAAASGASSGSGDGEAASGSTAVGGGAAAVEAAASGGAAAQGSTPGEDAGASAS